MASRPNSSQNTSRAILVIVGILVLAALGYFASKYFSKLEEGKAKDQTINQLREEVVELEEKITEFELADQDQEMELAANREELSRKNDEYRALLDRLTQYKRENKSNLGTIRELEGRLEKSQQLIAKYEKYLANAEAKIQSLEADNDSIKQNEGRLKTQNQHLITDRERVADDLAKTRELASILQGKNIRLINIRKNEKEDEDQSFRRGSLYEMKVCVTIVENLVALPGERKLYLILEDPQGQLINHDLGLSGSFDSESGQKVYSSSSPFDFRRLDQEVCVRFMPKTDYKWVKGTYYVQLYADGNALGQTTFEVKGL